MTDLEKNIKLSNINLPTPVEPIANYSSFIKSENYIFVSGQIPIVNGKLKYVGKLGKELDIQQGQDAARLCLLNSISITKLALNNDLSRLERCLKITVFVNSTNNFYDQPRVADGASDLIRDLFKEKGDHARSAVGVNALPKNVCVEIESIFEYRIE
tara:strand:- start:132 stop:602 length:471 start_codon:yes stop_codon:yes gene_type:complete